ncbi:hypothetical protein HYW59_01975 [Candidatus Kaiserbacteria bacterium]|nr:hypothetical protein [Candidatus Kaiserbacteria bacterium]
MTHYQTAIVTTTIYVPKLLSAYAKDAKAHGHNPLFVVIGDKKTPQEAERFCNKLGRQSGLRVEYFSPERQESYLKKFPALKKHLPWNSIQRRNVGILFAYEAGCGTIITIDDDNFLVTKDFIGAHQVVGERTCDVVSTSTKWMNVCKLLKEKHGRTFYHRGFPLEKRLPKETWKTKRANVRPVVNAGLWLGDPDVDAMERLYYLSDPTDAISYLRKRKLNISPSKGTWTPFNSQNTAIRRFCIPAYFLSPLIGRYDDIWASYILKHIADHLGDSIVFGEPVVRQERNPHNYWKDLDQERYGHALTLRFVAALSAVKLRGQTYSECYGGLIEALPEALDKQMFSADERRFIDGMLEGMRIWSAVFARLKK